MGSATNVALPAIQADFQVDAITLLWILNTDLLSWTMFSAPVWEDCRHLRSPGNIFIYGIWVFTVSSLFTAVVLLLPSFLVSRVIGGMAAAMISVTGLAIVTSVFPAQERGGAIGVTVAAVNIGLSFCLLWGAF